MQRDIEDVAFTRALLDDLAAVASVDANRLFATDLSNGGVMAHRRHRTRRWPADDGSAEQ
jgi:poly(3-hydroxybutyrate) depolymerase